MDMGNHQHEKLKFLGTVYYNLKRSEIAYRQYLSNNKQFIYARVLKSCNDIILQQLVNHSYLLPDELLGDSLKLAFHLEVWREKWIALEIKNRPEPEDEFAFENLVTFPREAAQNLEKAFLELRNNTN